jgi:hypothetical protein
VQLKRLLNFHYQHGKKLNKKGLLFDMLAPEPKTTCYFTSTELPRKKYRICQCSNGFLTPKFCWASNYRIIVKIKNNRYYIDFVEEINKLVNRFTNSTFILGYQIKREK